MVEIISLVLFSHQLMFLFCQTLTVLCIIYVHVTIKYNESTASLPDFWLPLYI